MAIWSREITAATTACLKTLNDKKETGWRDEVTRRLDANYPDWKNPSGTYMVPREFPNRARKSDDGKSTEETFFNLLQTFGKSCSEPMFVIHSHNFAELISKWNFGSNRIVTKWVTGEHDFVIIHHLHGVIFFQVNRKYYQG